MPYAPKGATGVKKMLRAFCHMNYYSVNIMIREYLPGT
jgi:hypothetical protein